MSNEDTTAEGTPTAASTWKKKTVGGTLLSVPSGNTALVRAPGMQVFLQQGVIPNGLMSIVKESMDKGKAPVEKTLSSMMDDPEKLQEIVQLADAVVVYCCIDPAVYAPPKDEEGTPVPFTDPRREGDKLYVDEVDFNDKMFIFNFAVGGSSNLEKFREELELDVPDVSQGAEVENSPE